MDSDAGYARAFATITAAVLLIAFAEATHAALPRGTRLAVVSSRGGSHQVYVTDERMEDFHLLTDGVSSTCPTWSPDGRYIAVDTAREGINLYRPEGVKRRLKEQEFIDGSPAWSPDGQTVVYHSWRDVDPIGFYTVGVDGAGDRFLRRGSQIRLAWSPNGSRTLFRDGRDIMAMDPDGGNVAAVGPHPASDGQPAWSPDGTEIAFISNRDGDSALYRMDADGANPTRLHERGRDSWPSWLSDGSAIVFASGPELDLSDIYMVQKDGGRSDRLTAGAMAGMPTAFGPGSPAVTSTAGHSVVWAWLKGR
ncbi:hypothetical protein HN371_23220 [Candidatus Poribacteria bacterium]|nr:hypothetical protein [Candidatus Poribacteria bacterium]MBT5537217.1 hypothetical protein [Candidatus Poribacteria bacterium]MBT7096230.1 hypothetical protein [Candidatus Poribacteria bacterium]MBT7808960.1 hypothetical protein [Candidatus Poribacteria bacterium]